MEIESSDGSRTLLKMGSIFEFGRGSGFEIDDRTVSRRHVSFRVNPSDESSSRRAEFKVIGMNPIWIRSCKSRHEISTFRASECGEMEIGDMFCVSAKNPIWFTLRKADFEAETENTVNSDPQSVDISDIDPVKEFGFLVIGKEFDSYPKKMIRDIRNWKWFIEDPIVVDNEEDDADEVEENKRKIAVKRKRKNRKEEEEEEDEWTGESEEEKEKELLTKYKKI